MMGWAVGLFAVAAAGGATMLLQRRSEKTVPMGLAILHGLLAATALVLLAIPVVQGGAAGLVTVALGIFVLAAMDGFYLFATHLRTGSFPLPMGVLHGLLALTAFVVLLVALYA